jgi:coenzyme PQQ precursor peptide PqqA
VRQAVTGYQRQEAVNQACGRMYWTTPTLEEICIGLEINGYLPAEF